MKKRLFFGALLGVITSVPVMALLYLAEQWAGLPFVPFDLFDWLARVLPGDLITLGIDTIVGLVRGFDLGPTDTTAKLAEQGLALGLGLGIGLVLGLLIAAISGRSRWSGWQVGLASGLILYLGVILMELNLGLSTMLSLTLVWLALVIIGWGGILGRFLDPVGEPSPAAPAEANVGRRAALLKIASGSILVALGAWGLGRTLSGQEEASGAGQPLANLPEAAPTPELASTSTPAASPTATPPPEVSPTPGPSPAVTSTATPTTPATPLPTATEVATIRDQVPPAPGTRPELTPNEAFYRIDINTRPPVIDSESWILEVEGLFNQPQTVTFQDIMSYPTITQPITLRCISNPIGGDLISTSNWTGIRLRDLLREWGLRPEARELYIEAADGFYESVAMEDMMDPRTLLVYGMNGETLPVEHGFPLRIYIPNRYGMKQPKWITRIEAIDEQGPGYWVERGWSAEARPHIVSVIDTVAQDAAAGERIPIGGIAWAGDRGIQKVELQVDDGPWVETTLRVPPLSGLTWVQWRYDWPSSPGSHTFTVRATDGTGTLQTAEVQDVRPDGATGYHSVNAQIHVS